MPVATFIAKGLQTIAQIKNNSRCSNCGRCGEVEMVIYFRNADDVERNKSARYLDEISCFFDGVDDATTGFSQDMG